MRARSKGNVCAALAVLIVFGAVFNAGPVVAQTERPGINPSRVLVVGVKEAPPFVIKQADGAWTGISIDLWQRIAKNLMLEYRFVEEPTVQRLLDETAAGRMDVAVAALTVTAAREQALDFTQPFFPTGLGIAVPAEVVLSWIPIVRAVTSFGFVQAVAGLVGLSLLMGLAVWLFERRVNEDFAGGTRGLTSSVWWSTLAMTQRSPTSSGPMTLPGRIIAIIWMITSIIALAMFTASVTSVLTAKHLQGAVTNVGDLTYVRVGTIRGTAVEETLTRMNVSFTGFPNSLDGLKALRDGALDAFVYDKPLLAWFIRQRHSFSIKLLETTFEPQTYAFALPNGSPLRKPISVSVLNAMQDEWWNQTKFRYLGVN